MFFFRLLHRYRLLSQCLFVATFSLLLYGLFLPTVQMVESTQGLDKVAHFGSFLIVFLIGRFAFRGIVAWPYWLFPLASAVLLEFMQGQLIPTRVFSYLDMLANVVGVVCAYLLWVMLIKSGELEPRE